MSNELKSKYMFVINHMSYKIVEKEILIYFLELTAILNSVNPVLNNDITRTLPLFLYVLCVVIFTFL